LSRFSAAFLGLALGLLAVIGPAAHVHAQTQSAPPGIAAEVTDDVIAVTSDFRGARITVFGATPSRRSPGDVVVAIRGPGAPITVMRKRRIGILWLNGDPVRFEDAPSFHAIATARPLVQIASTRDIVELGLDPAGQARLTSATPADADPSDYRRGLVRLQRARGLYQELPRALVMRPGGLFKAQVSLPANAPPGAYRADVYLFRNGRLQASEKATISISRQGIEQTIYALAKERPLFYGLFTVALALSAGWVASLVFRRS
jgi:uncharacterized protein (TIGR02186 family)